MSLNTTFAVFASFVSTSLLRHSFLLTLLFLGARVKSMVGYLDMIISGKFQKRPQMNLLPFPSHRINSFLLLWGILPTSTKTSNVMAQYCVWEGIQTSWCLSAGRVNSLWGVPFSPWVNWEGWLRCSLGFLAVTTIIFKIFLDTQPEWKGMQGHCRQSQASSQAG